ncbi:hypothetical protein ACFXGT_27720 [Streptomyces sp. NPDC059352]|uniref:hypothetical protein n=1 Tax=Streptomyces sp. NPDC059352 TaxID=3346810 RepID=UPI00367B9093
MRSGEFSGIRTPPDSESVALKQRVLALLAVSEGRETLVPLGGDLFDVVITAAGPAGHRAVAAMTALKHCGPVLAETAGPWLWWLVPPRTTSTWRHHPYGISVGAPAAIRLPPPHRTAPPAEGGTYWLRSLRDGALNDPGPLRDVLGQEQPVPAPHASVALLLTGIHL